MAQESSSHIPDEDMKILQDQIYNLVFVDDESKLRRYSCCSCQSVAIFHRMANCGDVYCYYCYFQYHNHPCLKCKAKVMTGSHDFDFQRKVFALKVKCKFNKNGCNAEIELGISLKHADVCKFSTEKLLPKLYSPNPTTEALEKLNDDVSCMKRAMQSLQIENEKLKDALKQSEKSTELLRRKQKEEFENKLLELKYSQAGEFAETSPTAILWRVKGFQKKLQGLMGKDKRIIRSEEFFTLSDGIKFKPWLWSDSDDRSVNIRLEFCDDLISEGNPSTAFLHSRKYILLDKRNAFEKNSIEFIDRPLFGMKSTKKMLLPIFKFSRFFPISLLQGENSYLSNDEILIIIIFEPISLLFKQIAANVNVLLWQIDNYTQRKKDEVDGVKQCHISRPFKTSFMGHLLHVELFLNGCKDGSGQFLSIFTTALLGENDECLGPKFKCKSSYHILDQSDSNPKENIVHELSSEFDESNLIWGVSKFSQHVKVENPKYLKGDVILIQVVAEVL